jgi:hypothetical protein
MLRPFSAQNFTRKDFSVGQTSLQVQCRAENWTGKSLHSLRASPLQLSFRPKARSPSGKAMVCKTIIGGSIPPRASNIFRCKSFFSCERQPFLDGPLAVPLLTVLALFNGENYGS